MGAFTFTLWDPNSHKAILTYCPHIFSRPPLFPPSAGMCRLFGWGWSYKGHLRRAVPSLIQKFPEIKQVLICSGINTNQEYLPFIRSPYVVRYVLNGVLSPRLRECFLPQTRLQGAFLTASYLLLLTQLYTEIEPSKLYHTFH